jgi:hypothetical protein
MPLRRIGGTLSIAKHCASHGPQGHFPRSSSSHPGHAPRDKGTRMALTPEQRSLAARAAAHAQWAKERDRTARTATARKAFMDRFEREVDPDGSLDPVERARRATNARTAYYLRLSLKSALARAARKKGGDADGTAA